MKRRASSEAEPEGGPRRRKQARFWKYELVTAEEEQNPQPEAPPGSIHLEVAFKTESKGPFEKLQARIAKELPGWCGHNVVSEFVSSSWKHANIVAVGTEEVAMRQRRVRSTDIGAILAIFPRTENQQDTLYIRLMCATVGRGRLLLDLFLRYVADNLPTVQYVTLSALPSVINFYRRLGFINAERECKELDSVQTLAAFNAAKKFKNDNVALDDAEFRLFLEELVKHRLVGNKECQGIGLNQQKNECSAFGYEMTYCVPARAKRK